MLFIFCFVVLIFPIYMRAASFLETTNQALKEHNEELRKENKKLVYQLNEWTSLNVRSTVSQFRDCPVLREKIKKLTDQTDTTLQLQNKWRMDYDLHPRDRLTTNKHTHSSQDLISMLDDIYGRIDMLNYNFKSQTDTQHQDQTKVELNVEKIINLLNEKFSKKEKQKEANYKTRKETNDKLRQDIEKLITTRENHGTQQIGTLRKEISNQIEALKLLDKNIIEILNKQKDGMESWRNNLETFLEHKFKKKIKKLQDEIRDIQTSQTTNTASKSSLNRKYQDVKDLEGTIEQFRKTQKGKS